MRRQVGRGDADRRILHCDMDCFFAAVHMRDDPSLRGRPVVIGGDPQGRGVVAAASYEARAFGVHSAMPAARASRLLPDGVFLRPEFERYQAESDRVFAVFREVTDLVQPVSIDEAYLDVSDCLAAYGSATAIAKELKSRIKDEIGLTVSIGVAPNRLVAKIASDYRKPDGLTVVPPQRVQEFLGPLSVRALMGVGPATQAKLNKTFGVETVAELRRVSLVELCTLCGKNGEMLYRFARGEDDRPVDPVRVRKSLGSERTYAEDLSDQAAIAAEISRQSQGVARSLSRRGLRGTLVTIKVRYDDFETVTRSKTLGFSTDDGGDIEKTALELLQRTEANQRPVRLLGVTMGRLMGDALETNRERQFELF